jgi:molybdopterin synthase catalytic subunit
MAVQAGRTYVKVTGEPLSISHYCELAADPGAGAISTFTGVTRNSFQGKVVLKLEYEAYIPMAVKKLQVRVCTVRVSQRMPA